MNIESKIKADSFIRACVEMGKDPYAESKIATFGGSHMTRAVRKHVVSWDNRQMLTRLRNDESADAFNAFLRTLPSIGNLAVEETLAGKPPRKAYRVYCLETKGLVFEMMKREIPMQYQASREACMAYVTNIAGLLLRVGDINHRLSA